MHKRPSLQEALSVLKRYSHISSDCVQALDDYEYICSYNKFLAARMVVDIVDHFYHIQESRAHG